MTGFDFFSAGELPSPSVSPSEAEAWAWELFGLRARAVELGSQQDANFLLLPTESEGSTRGTDSTSSPLAVMKVANGAFDRPRLDEQDRAADWIVQVYPGLRAGGRWAAPDGSPAESKRVQASSGAHVVRLVRFLGGGTLNGSSYLTPAVVGALGTISGEVSRALSTFPKETRSDVLQWDLRHARRVVEALYGEITDDDLRVRVVSHVRRAADHVESRAGALPLQVIHGDLTDDNVVCSSAGAVIDGVIDFGDLMESWRVAEVAVTLSSVLHHDGATPLSVLPAVSAFNAVCRLEDDEIEALWPLVVLRGAVLVASSYQQLRLDGGGDYVTAGLQRERLIFDRATSVPIPVMTALIRSELDRASAPIAGTRITDLVPAGLRIAELDVSVTSRALDDGVWERSETARSIIDRQVEKLRREGAELVIGYAGDVDATRMRPLATDPAATVRTGADVWGADGSQVVAPWPGDLSTDGESLRLRGETTTLILAPAPEAPPHHGSVLREAVLGWMNAHTRYRVTVIDNDLAEHVESIPEYIKATYLAGWRPFLSSLRPTASEMSPVPGQLVNRRKEVVARVQEQYYANPPQIERGWKHHLISPDGRVYLDMVNNVTVLGHSHPRIVETVGNQWSTFNSNSRFHYESIVEFGEKLTALLPEGLDTVFLVNSGSEAVELALRLARVHTRRRDLVAVREGYHGWTYLADAVSTSSADNPAALETRPDWIHTVPAPNTFRGQYRGVEVDRYGMDAAASIRGLAEAGHPPAAFICEAFYGNAGGMTLPDGYLTQVYSAVREVGGLAIADEVQAGLGRLGSWFWGFEQQAVVPDIVTIAKSIGDGHPVGAVITSKEIATSYAREGYFFSSTGGSPVSSRVGSTVLDVLEEEDLPGNARRTGAHLKSALEALADRHPLIGAVHGEGLYIGVEFVRDRTTLEPATRETQAICERLLELGVIVQPTGDHLCVLKIKPPLCFDRDAADFFVDALDRVLATGW